MPGHDGKGGQTRNDGGPSRLKGKKGRIRLIERRIGSHVGFTPFITQEENERNYIISLLNSNTLTSLLEIVAQQQFLSIAPTIVDLEATNPAA